MSEEIVISPRICRDLEGSSKKCGICGEASKYTCPRCNLPYCSVLCFKHQKHSGCSESFYKEWFVEELKRKSASDEEKRRIIRMLKDLEEEECDTLSLAERLEGVNMEEIDADDLWNKMTKEEQDEFVNSLRNGSCEVETWTPWWVHHDMKLVTEIGTSGHEHWAGGMQPRNPGADATKLDPPGHMKVPPLTELLGGKEPSPLVRNNLVSVLYSYAFFCRLYNGSMRDFTEESAPGIVECCPFLQKGVTQQSCEAALHVSIEACQGHSTGRGMLVEVVLDVYHILIGPSPDEPKAYVIRGMSELHLVCKSCRDLSRKLPKEQRPDTSHIFQALKKIEFLIAWVNDHAADLRLIAYEVMCAYKKQKTLLKEQSQAETKVRRLKADGMPSSPLIQEIK